MVATLVASVTAIAASSGAIAQPCQPAWDSGFESGQTPPPVGDPGLSGTVRATVVFDDGTGSALYAGGTFTTAGGLPASNIAKWNGSSWSPLESGTNGAVLALTVYDDGTGSALYAGGVFTAAGGLPASNIAKWDGSSWSQLGSGMNERVEALAVFDDGTGLALYAGGRFGSAGGVLASRIAKWDGSSWSPLGSGMNSFVKVLAVFDDGTGTALFSGGAFSMAGVVTVNSIAKWDGSSWSPLDSGVLFKNITGFVTALSVFDDGTGSALYIGGVFTTAGGLPASNIAKWNGSAWSPLASGMSADVIAVRVNALPVYDDGTGSALYAGGRFTMAGGASACYIAKWDSTTWSPVGSGMNEQVFALTVYNDGTGEALYAGGLFTIAGGFTAKHIAKWNGNAWADPDTP